MRNSILSGAAGLFLGAVSAIALASQTVIYVPPGVVCITMTPTATETVTPTATASRTPTATRMPSTPTQVTPALPTVTSVPPTPTQIASRPGLPVYGILHNTSTRIRVRDCTDRDETNPYLCPQAQLACPAGSPDRSAAGTCPVWVNNSEIALTYLVYWPDGTSRNVWLALRTDKYGGLYDYWAALCFNGISLGDWYVIQHLVDGNTLINWVDIFNRREQLGLEAVRCHAPAG